jgi:phospholipid/cholesterol/gamma-HCH transport system substrate-binding protein
MPRVAKRLVEALDEAVVVLKAVQKSFLLSGKAEEVREEEAERDKKRQPAGGK